METNSASAPVAKEFRFYPDSKIVTVVLQDDTTRDFMGPENFHCAFSAVHHAGQVPTEVALEDEGGESTTYIIPQGTPHETFEA